VRKINFYIIFQGYHGKESFNNLGKRPETRRSRRYQSSRKSPRQERR
jgi:hypothetical protein